MLKIQQKSGLSHSNKIAQVMLIIRVTNEVLHASNEPQDIEDNIVFHLQIFMKLKFGICK